MANEKMVSTGGTGVGLLDRGAHTDLKSYQTAAIVHDATLEFCRRYLPGESEAHHKMVEAAHHGKNGIVEGCEAAAMSKMIELKLTGLARANLEKLLAMCEQYLRVQKLPVWDKNSPDALKIRVLAYEPDRSYACYRSHIHRSPESAANTLLCLINQATYLLRRQMESLENQVLLQSGGAVCSYRVRRRGRS